MQDKPFYPALSEANLLPLKAALTQAQLHPDYLDRADCPFSDGVKSLLRPFLAPSMDDVEIDLADGQPEAIEAQVLRLMKDLDRLGQGLTAKDHGEQLSYLKLKTAMVEKLLGIRERSFNLKEMSDFQLIIMQFLEEICTKDQTTELMLRLKDLKSVGEINDFRK